MKLAVLVTDLPSDEAKSRIATMVATMMHEPFYKSGMYSVPKLGMYVGWVDPRGPGAQEPIVQQVGNKTLIFAGEHFGDPIGSPSQPRFGVDAEALLSAYERQAERALRELNGWFAGVLIDAERGESVIFNDRLGIHRVYHVETTDGIALASEAKALLAICPDSREIDLAGLGQMLAVGSVFDDRTLFRGIARIPGGSCWLLRTQSRADRRRYFTPSELEDQAPLSAGAFYDALRDTLARVVPKYFSGSSPAALSLTGGFDSRAILAFGGSASPWRLAYTYNGLYRECYDVKVARRVAAVSGYRHDVIGIDDAFLAGFSDLASQTVWVTDGTLDVTATHELYLSRLARALAPVRVTGNYGGEVFRRISTFKPSGLPRALLAPELVLHLDNALETFAALKRRHPVSFAVFDEVPSNLFGRLSAAQSQLTVRTPYTDNALVSLAYQNPRPSGNETAGWTRIIAEASPRLAAIPTDRGKLGRDRWTAHAERLYGYAMFKAEWYYDAGMPAWLSRIERSLARRSPPFFAGSHKIQHYRLWFRDHVADYLEDLLNSASRSRPYLDGVLCRNLVTEHRSGAGNRVGEIAAIATIELVNRVFLDAPYPAKSIPEPVEQLVS